MKTSFLALVLICGSSALHAMDAPASQETLESTLSGSVKIVDEKIQGTKELTKMRHLLESGLNIHAGINGKTFICAALEKMDNGDHIGYDRIMSLLALGAPINREELVTLFLNKTQLFHCRTAEHFAFFNATFEAAVTGSTLALQKSQADALTKCIDLGDPIFGMNSLMWAAARGNLAFVKQIVGLKANILKADRWGYTPLHFAVLNGHVPVIEFLLQVLASSLLAKTGTGKTPTDLAISANKSPDVLRALAKRPGK